MRGKYRDVILPMTVLRRLDAVLEGSKQAVLDMKATLDDAGVVEQDPALRQAAGQAFYNTSRFTLRDLRARANRQQLTADFQAYLDGFSPNVQDILENFEFRNQIPRLSRADALGTLIEKLTSPDINLSPDPLPGRWRHRRLPASRGVCRTRPTPGTPWQPEDQPRDQASTLQPLVLQTTDDVNPARAIPPASWRWRRTLARRWRRLWGQ